MYLSYTPGEVMPNGATVILMVEDNEDGDRAFVLAVNPEGKEYVTWAVNDRGTYSGHYHSFDKISGRTAPDALKEATDDLMERAGMKKAVDKTA